MHINLIERIAKHADIDTRRALGIYGKLPKTALQLHSIPPTTFRYFPQLKKIVYINFDETHDVFLWEVYDDIEPRGEEWVHGPNGRHRGVWRRLDGFTFFDKPRHIYPFRFAGMPEIIT